MALRHADKLSGISFTLTLHLLYSFLLPFFFFFNDTATTEIYTLSLHDALPILDGARMQRLQPEPVVPALLIRPQQERSEEHTSELQSRQYLVCRLLLEKKKNKIYSEIGTSPC